MSLSLDFQRNVDRYFGPGICWLLTIFSRLRREPSPPPEVRKILVILLSEMGALVLARPMLERLREKYPRASVFVLSFEQNREVIDVMGVIPSEHVLAVRNGSLIDLAVDSLRILRRIRALGVDVTLDGELFARVSAIYSALSGAPIRVGFHRHTQEGLYRGDFINRPVPYNPYQHIAEQFVTLAEAIDSTTVPKVKRPVPPGRLRLPRMEPGAGELSEARQRLDSNFPAVTGKPIVFLCPGAGPLPVRAWPLSHFCRVTEDLVARSFAVGIIGLPQDRELARAIQVSCASPACVDLTGDTPTIRDMVMLLHLGALLLANDGGCGHFAALTTIPAIVLYGPETPALYGSLGEHVVNIYKPLSCSPCLTAYNHRRSPCDGDNVCLKAISPEEVLEKAYAMLGVNTRAGSAGTPGIRQ